MNSQNDLQLSALIWFGSLLPLLTSFPWYPTFSSIRQVVGAMGGVTVVVVVDVV